MTVDLQTARELLNFNARIGDKQRADEQLEGAVALHNMLVEHGVAYLADEVGMGKTYVALGVLALFRHFDPDFRVLVIAPQENIQTKWMKELDNFVAHNVRFPDLRMKGLADRPVRARVSCSSLLELVRETSLDSNRDFFARLSSFSFALGRDTASWRHKRDQLRDELPWLDDAPFDLRLNKEDFKANFARAVCCALPEFDLVIIDEAHALKHGFGPHVSARNRVLGLALGHTSERPDPRVFRGYGPRAKRVLLLSATPVEDTYKQLWNQLHVLGHNAAFDSLRDDAPEAAHKKTVSRFLVRRVTSLRAGGELLTKNLYRREWRDCARPGGPAAGRVVSRRTLSRDGAREASWWSLWHLELRCPDRRRHAPPARPANAARSPTR